MEAIWPYSLRRVVTPNSLLHILTQSEYCHTFVGESLHTCTSSLLISMPCQGCYAYSMCLHVVRSELCMNCILNILSSY